MKYTLRIPTAQYAYIECQFEGEAEEAVREHNRLIGLYNASQEPENTPILAPKDWIRVLDTYLVENHMQEEDYTNMSDKQRGLINEVKKALNRIKAKTEDIGTRAESKHRTIN